MTPPCIVYLCHETGALGGAALSLGNLIRSLGDRVHPIVVVRAGADDPVHSYFAGMGMECIVIPFELNTTLPACVKTVVKYVPKLICYHVRQTLCLHRAMHQLSHRGVALVHSNSSVFTFGHILAQRLGTRHVWHLREFQDLDFHIRPFMGWKHLRRRIHRADAAIAITRAVYDHWQLERARRGLVMWDAVRSRRDIVYVPTKEKYFVFCAARLSDKKGTDTAIRAFGLSGLAREGYRLVVLGLCPPDYRPRLDALIRQCGVDDAVDFRGFSDNTREAYVHATAFLMCSQNEGLGRVTVEALFYGCPVIARNSGGTPEFIRHGANGFLFDNEVACARLMRHVATAPMAGIVKAARQTALDYFCEETYGEHLLALYADVLAPDE